MLLTRSSEIRIFIDPEIDCHTMAAKSAPVFVTCRLSLFKNGPVVVNSIRDLYTNANSPNIMSFFIMPCTDSGKSVIIFRNQFELTI